MRGWGRERGELGECMEKMAASESWVRLCEVEVEVTVHFEGAAFSFRFSPSELYLARPVHNTQTQNTIPSCTGLRSRSPDDVLPFPCSPPAVFTPLPDTRVVRVAAFLDNSTSFGGGAEI